MSYQRAELGNGSRKCLGIAEYLADPDRVVLSVILKIHDLASAQEVLLETAVQLLIVCGRQTHKQGNVNGIECLGHLAALQLLGDGKEGEDIETLILRLIAEIGDLLEDVVAQIFAKKTGLSVFEDHWMYQHPIFPFLIADVDRFVMLPDGRKAILECKTAHYDMQFKWANGSVPRHYELQVRHYMAVMNIDVAFIACLFSNNENDFVWQKIERDLDEEENTIMELEAFWHNHVLARVEPPLVEKPDAVLESLRRYFGPADKSEPSVDLDCKFLGSLKEILNLKEEKKVIDAQSKALETRIKSLYAPIVEQMGTACKASCEHGSECFRVTYNPQYREGINKDRLSALRAQYPEIYDEFVDQTELRIFKVVKTAIA